MPNLHKEMKGTVSHFWLGPINHFTEVSNAAPQRACQDTSQDSKPDSSRLVQGLVEETYRFPEDRVIEHIKMAGQDHNERPPQGHGSSLSYKGAIRDLSAVRAHFRLECLGKTL